jgi:hypothetical protein
MPVSPDGHTLVDHVIIPFVTEDMQLSSRSRTVTTLDRFFDMKSELLVKTCSSAPLPRVDHPINGTGSDEFK